MGLYDPPTTEGRLRSYTAGFSDEAIAEMAKVIDANVGQPGKRTAVWHLVNIYGTDTETPCACQHPDCLAFAEHVERLSAEAMKSGRSIGRLAGLPPIEAFAVGQQTARQVCRGVIRQQRKLMAAELGTLIPEDSGLVTHALDNSRMRASCITLPKGA